MAKRRAKKRTGLRGTVAQHRARAQEYIGWAQKELARGDCKDALVSASMAMAEAEWLPGGVLPGTLASRAMSLVSRAGACIRGRGYQPQNRWE